MILADSLSIGLVVALLSLISLSSVYFNRKNNVNVDLSTNLPYFRLTKGVSLYVIIRGEGSRKGYLLFVVDE